MNIEDYEKTQAAIKLMSALAEGEKTTREKGGLSIEEVEKNFGV